MDITCPHCAAAYRVPDALLKPGKKLRCAACKADWAPVAALPAEPAAEPAAAPAPPAPPPIEAPPPPRAPAAREEAGPPPPLLPVADPRRIRQAHEAARPSPGRLLPLAWVASIAAVLALVAALVVFRGPIAAAWPPFARVAQVIGG